MQNLSTQPGFQALTADTVTAPTASSVAAFLDVTRSTFDVLDVALGTEDNVFVVIQETQEHSVAVLVFDLADIAQDEAEEVAHATFYGLAAEAFAVVWASGYNAAH